MVFRAHLQGALELSYRKPKRRGLWRANCVADRHVDPRMNSRRGSFHSFQHQNRHKDRAKKQSRGTRSERWICAADEGRKFFFERTFRSSFETALTIDLENTNGCQYEMKLRVTGSELTSGQAELSSSGRKGHLRKPVPWSLNLAEDRSGERILTRVRNEIVSNCGARHGKCTPE